LVGHQNAENCLLNYGFSALLPLVEPKGSSIQNSLIYVAVLNETELAEGSDAFHLHSASMVDFPDLYLNF